MLTKIALAAGILALSACAPFLAGRGKKPVRSASEAQRELQERLRSNPELSILFIGNSYSFGVPSALEKMAASHGRTIHTGHSTYSGWTLARHATYEPTLRKIRSGKWDIIVFQEFSRIPARIPLRRNLAMFGPLDSLTAESRQAGAIPILCQTWGRRHGDPGRICDSFTAMTRRLRLGYQAASRSAGGLVIVPAGDFWERQVAAGQADALFMPDGSHPTEAGNRLTATAFYQTLFR